jgi:hypothetical protein
MSEFERDERKVVSEKLKVRSDELMMPKKH